MLKHPFHAFRINNENGGTVDTFLGKVAREIIEKHQNNAHQLAVILPSRRAVAYLKKELRQSDFSGSMWLPDIFSIEDFVYAASGYEQVDPTALVIELFRVHQEIENNEKASLESFLAWAPMMVHDFNAIDENLADASALFSFLSEAKAIEKWRPDKNQLTKNEKEYVAFFALLKTYYHKLRQSLLKQRKAYQGMAIRAIHESGVLLDHEKWQHFIFAGFYALTQAEEELMKALKKAGKLTRFFDADQYYVKDKFHEAGKFLRNKATDEHFHWLFDYYREKNGEINISGIPGNIGQARQAGALINEINKHKNTSENDKNQTDENTAIVLADESLLMPVLNSLPKDVSGINVTMGFPVNQTSTGSLLRLLLKSALEKERYKRKNIHVDDLLQIINLPVSSPLLENPETLRLQLIKNKKVFYQPEEVTALLPSRLADILLEDNNPSELLSKLIEFTKILSQNMEDKTTLTLEVHSASIICDRLIELQKILQKANVLNTFNDLEKLLRKTVLNARLPFSGEPLKGLQIMGMLESRALDFENIIMLSVNEGSLPAGKSYNSLIPQDIRRKFNLPTYQDNDSIYAYHFYRLLQRAKKVHLLYNTQAGTLGGKEQSRFIKQLKHELPHYNPEITLNDELLTPPVAIAEERTITVEKDETVMEDLQKALQKGNYSGLSASGLKTLTNCSLQYYFKYVLRLEKTDEIEETIPMNIFGDAVHLVLENIFRPDENTDGYVVSPQYLKQQNVREQFIKNLPEEYTRDILQTGRNRLMVDLAENLLKRFLDEEIQAAQNHKITIKSVEEQLAYKTVIRDIEVYFKGKADRIDETGHTKRIIDYKTGNVKPGNLNQQEPFESLDELKSGEAIQVLFYDWLYNKMNNSDEALEGGIMLLANPSKHSIFFNLKKNTGITPEIRQQFENALWAKVEELLDPSVPFAQTEDRNKCEICDFRSICNR